MSADKHLFPFLSHAGRDWSAPSGFGGELPGVRDTRDQLIAKEVANGRPLEEVTRQINKIVRDYDHSVSQGSTPFPLKR